VRDIVGRNLGCGRWCGGQDVRLERNAYTRAVICVPGSYRRTRPYRQESLGWVLCCGAGVMRAMPVMAKEGKEKFQLAQSYEVLQ